MKNYHSRLLIVSEKFDSIIEKLKASYIDEKYQLPWWLWLLAAPLRDIAKVKELQKGISGFFKSSAFLSIVPFLTGIGGWMASFFYPFEIPFPEWTITAITFVIGYIIILFMYFPQLLEFKSEHFHTGAYRVWRRQEYELFQPSFLDGKDEFYFKGLYDYVTNSTEGHKAIADVVNNGFSSVETLLNTFVQNDRSKYEAKIYNLEEKISEMELTMESVTKEYDHFIQKQLIERDEILQESQFIVDLLKDLNTLLFRTHNNGISTQDLDILTGFTLYQLVGNKLLRIEDRRTSGASPKMISLDDPTYADYGVVQVIKQKHGQPVFNHPYSGHVVVSYKMRIDNTGTWVYNFHFDESNTKAWKLLVQNAIIESKEIYRLVHALTLLTINSKQTGKEGAVNE